MEDGGDRRPVVGEDLPLGIPNRLPHAGQVAAGGGFHRNVAVGCTVVIIVAKVGVRMDVGPAAGELIDRVGARRDRLRADCLEREIVGYLRGDNALHIGFQRERGRSPVDFHRDG